MRDDDTATGHAPPDARKPPPRTIRPKPPQPSLAGPAGFGPLSWFILFLLLLWNLWSLLPKQPMEVTLPYTAFIAQVNEGNVASVRIAGDAITGSFVHPVTWPPPAQQPGQKGSEATKENKPAAGQPPSAQKQNSPRPATYSTFSTMFPRSSTFLR